MKVLITGGAGNLGTLLARHLLNGPYEVNLLEHHKPVGEDIRRHANVHVFQGDLANPSTLLHPCEGIECIVHFAGLLFAPHPEQFLPKTNVQYVNNLAQAAVAADAQKLILVSFPQVEGETTVEHPATDRLDRESPVIHFRTRLAAERALLEATRNCNITPVIFRSGLVYGPGLKLIEAARKLLRFHLMAVWESPTWIHPIALPDFLRAMEAAICSQEARGIYNVADDQPLLFQNFLDLFAATLSRSRPWRLPDFCFHAAAATVEAVASVLGTAAPLNRDIIRAGMTSCVADTSRMKNELLPELRYPTAEEGMEMFRRAAMG